MSKSLTTKLGIVLLVVGGVILWNTWALGFLNHGAAGYTQMSISELNVGGQPFSRFFTDTEWLSGLFILIGGLLLVYAIRKGGYFMLIALVLVAIIGGLTIFDATHPVDCNRYQHPACALKWARGEVSAIQKAHGIESETTGYITVLLSIELVVWTIYARLSKGRLSYSELCFVVLLALGVATPLLVPTNSITITTEAVGQRVWNTLTSVLLLYIIYQIRHAGSAMAPARTTPIGKRGKRSRK